MDGRIWEITRGEDYTIGTPSMCAMLGTQAAKSGMRAIKRKRGDVITFQFVPVPSPSPTGSG